VLIIRNNKREVSRKKQIWIVLDNSPHVPFFKPIIRGLEARNYEIIVTARDCFQVCILADLLKVKCTPIGTHYGKNIFLKIFGLLVRTMQIIPTVLRERPALAVSHGFRTQVFVCALLRIPSVMIFDYEYVKGLQLFHPTWVFVPDVITDSAIANHIRSVFKYPGIKEDVYVPYFKPDPRIRETLGLNNDEIVVSIRPPASEAHYRSPESEKLFSETVEALSAHAKVKMVILPRNERQADSIRRRWPDLFSNGKIIIPGEVVDGLNLMWHSDLVISGGGTMNREAAALGVPVYSIFRGKIGNVDQYVAEKGRLVFLDSAADFQSKLQLKHREKGNELNAVNHETLKQIVCSIDDIFNKKNYRD
jgi:uncharacterized protein